MDWYGFYKVRLDLNLSIVEHLLVNEEFAQHMISYKNQEKIRAEIHKLMSVSYSDLELHELQNKLEIIALFEEYQRNVKKFLVLEEKEYIDQIIVIDKFIKRQTQSLEDKVEEVTQLSLSAMEMGFRIIRKDYQELFLFKELKKLLVQNLTKFDSPQSRLAYIFHMD